MSLTKNLTSFYPIIALIFCSLPYFMQGYPVGDDSVMGLIRIKEFQLALADHQFPPYWADNLYGGYGSPIFLFYAPLYMFVAAVLSLLTGSIICGSISAITLFTFIGAAGIYLLVQEVLIEKSEVNQSAARIAVYFFILSPYLISDKIIRVANSEYTALCLAPLALFGLIKIKRAQLSGSLILAAGLALGILAHNLTALTIMAMLIILSPVLYWAKPSKQVWLFVLGGIILGLLLSVFFWLPALYYKSLTHTEQLTDGFYDYHKNFKPLINFFNNSDYFSMGLLNLWVIIKSALILWRERSQEKTFNLKLAKAGLIFALLFIILQTKLSLPVWNALPYLALFQFPWRMMGPLAFVIAIMAGLLFPVYCRNHYCKSSNKLESVILLLCIINMLPLLTANLPRSEQLIKNLTSILETNTLHTMVHTSTEVDEYLPKSAKIKLEHYTEEDTPLIRSATSNANIGIRRETGTEIMLETNAPGPLILEIKRWFFPGWKASVNGVERPVLISEKGLLSVQIPSGHNEILLKLHPPVLRRVLVWISLTALVLWLTLLLSMLNAKKHSRICIEGHVDACD